MKCAKTHRFYVDFPWINAFILQQGCSKKKRSVNEEALGPDDHRFTTGSLLHIMRENSAASLTGNTWSRGYKLLSCSIELSMKFIA